MNNWIKNASLWWQRFFETPSDYTPIALFRIGISTICLLKMLFLYPSVLNIYGTEGWINWEITSALSNIYDIHLADVFHAFSRYGFTEDQIVYGVVNAYLLALFCILIGLFTRFFAIFAWFLNMILNNTIQPFTYGIDCFIYISLFYFTFMPVGKSLSVDKILFKYTEKQSIYATYSLRILQIHLCFIYLSSGFEKLLSPQWWSGNALWFALMKPQFNQYDFSFLCHYPALLIASSVVVIFVETAYPLYMWHQKTRHLGVFVVTGLHLGIGLFLGLWFFAFTMIVLTWSGFGYKLILKSCKL